MSVARFRSPQAAPRARWPLRFAWLLSLAVVPLGPGACASYGPPQSSAVARGEYFATGNPDYDEFFVRLFRLQVGLGQAPEALAQTRAALARQLGLPEKSDTSALSKALVERAGQLQNRGLSVRAEASREPDAAVTLRVSGTKSAADAELLTTFEQSLRTLNQLRQELPSWRRELDALPPRGVALESGLETAFVGTGRGERDEIRESLADAQKIMGLMGPRWKEVDQASAELSGAFTTAFPPPAPPPPEPPPSEPDPKPKARPTRSGAGGRPAGTRPPAKPAPASDSGEAPSPPKPAQGPAKPDFEP